MRCYDCKSWGDGDGTGLPYDAGHMNYCMHQQVAGNQHPSYGACGEPKTMIYTGGQGHQHVMTRGTFGCVLFSIRTGIQSAK